MNLIRPVSEQSVREQRASYTALLNALGTATAEEIETTLAERKKVEPEPGLTPEVTARLRQRIATKMRSDRKSK